MVQIRLIVIYCILVGKLELIRNVLAIKRYASIAALAATGIGTTYYFLTMSLLPAHFDIAVSAEPAYMVASIGLTLAISVLGGINIAMIAYRIQRMKMAAGIKSDSSAMLGGSLAVFTPGCPACTTPLAVVLGAIGGLAVFPMQGLELKFISVGALIFSIYWITRSLQKHSCCSV